MFCRVPGSEPQPESKRRGSELKLNEPMTPGGMVGLGRAFITAPCRPKGGRQLAAVLLAQQALARELEPDS